MTQGQVCGQKQTPHLDTVTLETVSITKAELGRNLLPRNSAPGPMHHEVAIIWSPEECS